MRILVTGGGSFLATALLPRLRCDNEVIATYAPGSEPPAIKRVRWLALDLAAPLPQDLPPNIDAVIHLAQSRRYREFPGGALDMYEINVAAAVRLLDYTLRAGGRTFTYASSGSVYAPGPHPVRETDEPSPAGFYGFSKLAGERAVEQFRDLLAVHVLRPFFIYGPKQPGMMMRGLLNRVADGEDVTLAEPNGIHINPVFVEDAADAVLATLSLEESQTLNLAGPAVVSIRQIAELAGRLLDRAPNFAVGSPQPDLVASIERQSEVLGAPKTSFEEGLSRMVQAG
jgi:UDP-glucose 4-epimerase